MSLLSVMLRALLNGSPRRHSARRPTGLVTALCAALLVVAAASPALAESTAKPPRTGRGAPLHRATFGIGPATVSAADPRGYFSYSMGVGGSYKDKVAVTNFGSKPLTLGVFAADLGNAGNGAVVVGLQGAASHDAGDWVQLPSKNMSVRVPASSSKGPGQVVIPFRIVVPAGAEPGDHGAAIVAVLSTLGKNPKGENVRLDQRVATRMYIRVAGPLQPALTIDGLRASYRGTLNPFGHGTATVRYTVHNTGNVRLSASQLVSVTGMFGTKSPTVAPTNIPLLFPGASQSVTVHVANVLPTIQQKANVTVTPLLFQDQQPVPVVAVSKSVSFFAVPWTFLAMIALALLLLGGGLWLLLRRRRRRRRGPVRPAGSPRGNGRHRPTDREPAVVPAPNRKSEHVASMKRISSTVVVIFAALVATLLGSRVAAADTVPFTDPNSSGYLGFCDQAGHQVRSGSLDTQPFTWRAVSSQSAPAGYGAPAGKATLVAYQPRQDVDPSEWSGKQLTGSSSFTNTAHPMAQGTLLDPSLVAFTGAFPPQWDGLVQLRLLYTAPEEPQNPGPYPAAVLRVTGNSWTQIGGGTVSCTAGKATSVETQNLPAAVFKSASAHVSKAAASAAARSSSAAASAHRSGAHASLGGASQSATPSAAATDVAGSGSGSSSAGGSAGQPGSSGAGTDASSTTPSSAGSSIWVWVVIAIVAVLVISAGVLARRRRARTP